MRGEESLEYGRMHNLKTKSPRSSMALQLTPDPNHSMVYNAFPALLHSPFKSWIHT